MERVGERYNLLGGERYKLPGGERFNLFENHDDDDGDAVRTKIVSLSTKIVFLSTKIVSLSTKIVFISIVSLHLYLSPPSKFYLSSTKQLVPLSTEQQIELNLLGGEKYNFGGEKYNFGG